MNLFGSILRSVTSRRDDGDCNWICDDCGAYMNEQSGFNVSCGSWCCKKCGSWNDVSENNILEDDDGYVGSYQYYIDEDKRNREEEEDLRELGIDPYDD